MEAFGMYLLKSVIWLTGFALVYILFLRNERFFLLNRIYLIAGILTSLLFPFLTVRYQVTLPYIPVSNAADPVTAGAVVAGTGSSFEKGPVFLALYICGIISVLAVTLRQSRSVIKAIKKAEVIVSGHPAKLIRTDRYSTSFSFFSYVFVNPSVTDAETEEIMSHELVHISQKHWIDLVLAEMLCIIQWFNPLAWIYFRLIRQNHEYLADEVALQRTSDPAIYRATLLNQIVGAPVVNLANSFNYSLNKKRFNMMKNIITSPYRKMKILLILPVFAIVLWSFAEPEFKLPDANEGAMSNENPALQEKKEVKGKVVESNGTPLPGTSIVLKGTTLGTTSDPKGNFKLEGVPENGELILSYVGYKFKVVKAVFTSEMIIKMDQDTVKLKTLGVPPPPPPPPPPGTGEKKVAVDMSAMPPPPPPPPPVGEILQIKSSSGKSPLFFIDGKEKSQDDIKGLDPNSIESISVLKDGSATAVYGEKGKDGVILVVTKKNYTSTGSGKEPVTVTGYGNEKKVPGDAHVIVEEMPSFPGGMDAMKTWIYGNIHIQTGMDFKTVTEPIYVIYTVGASGKVSDVKVRKAVSPLFDAEAIRVVSSMPDWKPGSQNGKPVAVRMQLPIDFNMKVPVK